MRGASHRLADGLSALRFLTVLGGGATAAPGPGALPYFPVVGLVVGAITGVGWWLVGQGWTALVAAVAAVAIDLVLTGGLHADGLADTGDGLLPPLPRERRFPVMADPHIGAFGVVTVVVVLLLRVSALASLTPAPLALAGLWAASRTAMAFTVASRRHARPDGGLGGGLRGGSARAVAAVGLPCALVAAAVSSGVPGAVAVLATLVVAAGVVAAGERRLGGWTGDVLGAAGVVAETIGLVVLAARW